MSVQYYPINEDAARRAKEMNSFSDYTPGGATAAYRQYVDEAAAIAEAQKERVSPEHHERIDYLLDLYARKLAENMNDSFAIDARVPSVPVVGPVISPRKKEKQNAAREKNQAEWQHIQNLLDKIRSTGMGGISADDSDAIQKLEQELAEHVKLQNHMKAVNAYFRRRRTLEGCPNLSPERIRTLTQQREADYFTGWEFEGGEVEVNQETNRLQILFDCKPDESVRSELKRNGFRWSPNHSYNLQGRPHFME